MKTIYIKSILILLMFVALNSCETDNSKHSHDDEGHDHSEVDSEVHQEEVELIKVSKEQFILAKMSIGSMFEQDFPEIVKTTGVVEVPPQNIEIISSFYEGFIKKADLLVGDNVRKGQALVTIENPDFINMQQEYLEIEEQIDYLKTEYERHKTLFDEQISSQKNFQKAESEYKQKLAQLNGLRKKLQLLNINISNVEQGNLTSVITLYSSIGGSVSSVNINKGIFVDKADKIMEIINTEHIHIELTVFEKDALKIKKGQKIKFRIPEISEDSYDAEVHLVGKSIDKTSRTIVVHGHLEDDLKNTFNIGMFVDADIEVVSNKVMALPEDAVVEEGDNLVVLKLVSEENGVYSFEEIEVELKSTYASFKEIYSEKLSKDDKFLVKGAFDIVGAGAPHAH